MRSSTGRSLWKKDLDAFENEYIKFKKEEADAEEVKKGMRLKDRNIKGAVTKPAVKVPRKNTKKAASADQDFVDVVAKPAAKGRPKKVTAKPKVAETEEEEDVEILALKDRLAKYNLDSSPEQSAMDVEGTKEDPKKKKAAKSKPSAPTIIENLDDESEDVSMPTIVENDESDEDDSVTLKGKKGRGRKMAAGTSKAAAKTNKTAKSSVKKRVGAQKLITDVLIPVDSSLISPEKKVRKMRASPFNKKSGSVFDRINSDNEQSSGNSDNMFEVPAPKARPQRAAKANTTYVISDSEDDVASVDDDSEDDSDFGDSD